MNKMANGTVNGVANGNGPIVQNGEATQNGTTENGWHEENGGTNGSDVYDPSQEPIFPPFLKLEAKRLQEQSLQFIGPRVTWYRPSSLSELLDIKKRHPDCKIVIGNTELGIETKFKKQLYPVLVAATHVRELSAVNRQESGIQFGASVTLATLDNTLKAAVKELPEEKTRVFAAFVEMLRWFAGHQIRNVAAIGGNIMTASPISDLNPLLLACGAVLDLGEFFYGYKQANRKEDDISIVNAGMRVVLDEKAAITDLSLAFGGMAPITVMATNTMTRLIGRLNTGARTKARARLVKVDPSAALAMPGVVDFVTHTDIPGSNSWGLHVKDDVVFAVDEVVHQGQPIGGILADTQVNAQRAAQAVVVEYDVMEPVITIADAIKKGSLYDYNPTIVCGDVDKAMAEADHVLEGEVHTEAQEHFYLEPHVAIAYPGEEDQIEVAVATQSLSVLQNCIAGVLGVQCNKVKTTVKRLGGGFGGKESRSGMVALPVAVAAVKAKTGKQSKTWDTRARHQRPVRCALERDEDMMMTGTRHPFLGKYKIGFSSDGKILAYDVMYYSNAGCSIDLSFAGAALVNIYTDGTVLVSHGGVEMGQGLHTKILQLTSQVLQLPVSKITVNGASIDVVPNTSPSAASVSSDMFGGAVVDACEKLLRRLKPIKAANPKFTWEQLILSTDIVFDVGKSINPAIDIGQIEGGFIQGYGLMVLEQYKVQPDGTLLTRGPGTYKIPSVGNIPQKFNVTLLRESGNPRAVYSSKGIGEPPLLLATSVLYAIHDAIRAARKDEGLDLDFRLDTPATPARIRMACSDRFTKMFEETEEESKAKPWFVDL
nr:hypothetical protein BaRGS_007467 [Batillaria attramentaria]